MFDVAESIETGKPLALKNKNGELFLFFHKFGMIFPIKQDNLEKEYGSNTEIRSQEIELNKNSVRKGLIRAEHVQEVFDHLNQITGMEYLKLTTSMWFVDNQSYFIRSFPSQGVIFNGKLNRFEKITGDIKAHILRVIYLKKELADENNISLGELSRYGFLLLDSELNYKQNIAVMNKTKENKNMSEINSKDIQNLLDCDKKRCGLVSYEREMLYDINAGHWEVFENEKFNKERGDLIARNPRVDIKKNGIIGIDFGTKSTVVMKQDGTNEISPIRIGSLSLNVNVSASDYENPTIISCMNISDFLSSYLDSPGRPNTSCEDLFVSYNAFQDYKNCSTDNFYAYYSDLKQWANSEKKEVIVQGIKKKETYKLHEDCSIDNKTLNAIEVYAYYIGMYINNMRNGIYLKYMMSFPVKYSKTTKELIRKSFERGLKKSLPRTIVENDEIMSNFSVQYQISEPAAYAVTVLEQCGFKPENEKEKYLYGIFDFGGGTTDFDFGIWRGADDYEYKTYNCDYVLECFGADSDVQLGGENILEMLAYLVFKDNKNMAAEKKIACALPVGQTVFIGGALLVNNSQSANRNLTLLKEALRPLWEQHDGWEEIYRKKGKTDECIEIQMYDFNGKAVPNCKFIINTENLIIEIKKRIQKGVDAFFKCIEKAILGNKSAQFTSEKVYIFLAGNSCKSKFVKEIFEKMIKKYNSDYAKYDNNKEQDRFELIEPLCGGEMDYKHIPNAKTSVAYGLLKSRPGGKIYVKKNYETDSNEETRFKYYLGTERKEKFDCKLTPMIKDEHGESKTAYNVWTEFQGAGSGVARIYYTEDARADSTTEKINIDNIPFHEINFEPEIGKQLYIKAIKPTVIVYKISISADIESDEFELDIDNY